MDLKKGLLNEYKTAKAGKGSALEELGSDPTLYMLTFLNVDRDDSKKDEKITLGQFASHLEGLMDTALVVDGKFNANLLPPAMKCHAKALNEVFAHSAASEVTLYVCHRLVRQIVVQAIINLGFDATLFYSRDGYQIFCKVLPASGKSEDVFMAEAESRQYVCKLRDNLEADPQKAAPAFNAFVTSQGSKFEQYDENDAVAPSGSHFRQVDKIRLCANRLRSELNFDSLIHDSYLTNAHPVHNQGTLTHLKSEWATFGKIYRFPQPLKEIRDYFGEKTALYFGWIQYSIFWIAILAVLSTICALSTDYEQLGTSDGIEIVSGLYVHLNSLGFFLMGIAIASYGIFGPIFWERKRNDYVSQWGPAGFSETAETRAHYRGARSYDPDTERFTKTANTGRLGKHILAFLVTILALAGAGALSIWFITLSLNANSDRLVIDVALVAGIKLTNFIYSFVAKALNNWENYQTDLEYQNALTVKSFSFQFLNYVVPLSYIGFWLCFGVEDFTDSDDSSSVTRCVPHYVLQDTLIVIMAFSLAQNVVEILGPYILYKRHENSEAKRIETLAKKNKIHRVKTYVTEDQARLSKYDGTEFEMIEMALLYGLIISFGICGPIVVGLGLLNLIIEIRVDSFKLCTLLQRPAPEVGEGLGVWEKILKVVSAFGVAFTLAMMMISIGFISTDNDGSYDSFLIKFTIFIVCERIASLKRVLFSDVISSKSAHVEATERKGHRIVGMNLRVQKVGVSDEETGSNGKRTDEILSSIHSVDPHEAINKKNLPLVLKIQSLIKAQ